mgnify:CR=1 FL=1
MGFAKPAAMPDTPRNPFARLLSRLSVGRKLLLIYLLDLCAVIYVTSILVNEKFLFIDFARKEIAGNTYISALRDTLIDGARLGADAPPRLSWPQHAQRLRAQELEHGPKSVEFRDVHFAYPSAREVSLASLESVARAESFVGGSSVLNGIDFRADAGSQIGRAHV